MKQTPESLEKDVKEFLDNFEKFEYITTQRGFNTIEGIRLFKIFIDHHKYIEVQDD